MKKSYARDESFSKNSLCREIGEHGFKSTTSPNFRVCSRSGCHAAQRLQGGQWIDVVAPGKASVPQQQQLNLFSSSSKKEYPS